MDPHPIGRYFIPFYNVAVHGHVIHFTYIIPIILASVLLAGCSKAGPLAGIYLVSLRYNATVIRVGYFGLCARMMDATDWTCSANLSEFASNTTDPWHLYKVASHFRSDIVFPGLLIILCVIAIMPIPLFATFPSWHEEPDDGSGSSREVTLFPHKGILFTILLLNIATGILALVSAVWQHSASVAGAAVLNVSSSSGVVADVGPAAVVLVWLVFGLFFFLSVITGLLSLSLAMLSRYTSDD